MAKLTKAERAIIEQLKQENRQLDRRIRQIDRETDKIRSAENREAYTIPYQTVYDELIEDGTLADEMGWRNQL